MKLKIYNEKIKPEKTVNFTLDRRDNKILLVVVDEKGYNNGNILCIDENGIHLYTYVSPETGLPLDDRGRVIVCK